MDPRTVQSLLFCAAFALPLISIWLIHVTVDAYWERWWRGLKTRIFMVYTGVLSILVTASGAAVWYYTYHAYGWLNQPLALIVAILAWLVLLGASIKP